MSNVKDTAMTAKPVNDKPAGLHNLKTMNRFDLTKRTVAQLRNEEAVIGGIGNANFDLWATGQRPQNFYMLGSMGLTIPIALGVAIAQPDRHVVALEGDGSLLMQLGCLSTVAVQAPKNLTMVVWDNGIYQITGSQPTASHATTDLVAVARASGLVNSAWAADEEEFERLLAEALKGGAPHLIAARIDGEPGVGKTERDPMQIRASFMRGIGARK
jgi:thiamine pyrophosphate-dependent acetolactate synthase large subunit-like protein